MIILNTQSGLHQRLGIPCIASVTLNVVDLEKARNVSVPFLQERLACQPATLSVVHHHIYGLLKIGIIAVDKYHRNSLLLDFFIQLDIRVGQGGLGAFHDDAVNWLLHERLEHFAFYIHAVLGSGKQRRIALFRKRAADSLQNSRKNIFSDVCGHDRNIICARTSWPCTFHIGAAPTDAFSQSFAFQY